ncbi:hypothetical protein NH340_JMT06133 [Sarcoptes scabiei]|nr:hypothetical protein NH340_JMT06133 [Sarcoptes scabiei]
MSKFNGFTSIDEIEKNRLKWSLESDIKLHGYLIKTEKDLLSKIEQNLNSIEETLRKTDIASNKVHNLITSLSILSNTKFIENRVYEEDIKEITEKSCRPKVVKDLKTANSAQETELFLKRLMNSVDEALNFLNSSSEVSCEDVSVNNQNDFIHRLYMNKNKFNQKKLPYLFGSDQYLNSMFVGLKDEEDHYKLVIDSSNKIFESHEYESNTYSDDSSSEIAFGNNHQHSIFDGGSSSKSVNHNPMMKFQSNSTDDFSPTIRPEQKNDLTSVQDSHGIDHSSLKNEDQTIIADNVDIKKFDRDEDEEDEDLFNGSVITKISKTSKISTAINNPKNILTLDESDSDDFEDVFTSSLNKSKAASTLRKIFDNDAVANGDFASDFENDSFDSEKQINSTMIENSDSVISKNKSDEFEEKKNLENDSQKMKKSPLIDKLQPVIANKLKSLSISPDIMSTEVYVSSQVKSLDKSDQKNTKFLNSELDNESVDKITTSDFIENAKTSLADDNLNSILKHKSRLNSSRHHRPPSKSMRNSLSLSFSGEISTDLSSSQSQIETTSKLNLKNEAIAKINHINSPANISSRPSENLKSEPISQPEAVKQSYLSSESLKKSIFDDFSDESDEDIFSRPVSSQNLASSHQGEKLMTSNDQKAKKINLNDLEEDDDDDEDIFSSSLTIKKNESSIKSNSDQNQAIASIKKVKQSLVVTNSFNLPKSKKSIFDEDSDDDDLFKF